MTLARLAVASLLLAVVVVAVVAVTGGAHRPADPIIS
jgi:hypothetical protein